MAATSALWMSDTVDYARSIDVALGGGNYEFWEFGHLFWRPLGWLIYRAIGPLIDMIGGEAFDSWYVDEFFRSPTDAEWSAAETWEAACSAS